MTRPPVVLVAEDDPSVRLTLKFVLEDEGFEVLFAENGQEALALAQANLPDAILLDQMMPKMSGKQVFSALRSGEPTRSIPVFVLTGMDRENSSEWAGAQFVGKPFSPDDLVEKIKAALQPL